MTRTAWRALVVLALALGALCLAAGAAAHDGRHHHHGWWDNDRRHSDRLPTFHYTTTLSTPDSGTCNGATWANDMLKRTYVVHQRNGVWWLTVIDRGTFTTVAGSSPEACDAANTHHGSTVTAGVKGHVLGFLTEQISGGTFNPKATCAATCDRTAFVTAFFGSAATQSANIDKNVKYAYFYGSRDPSLEYHLWLDRGYAGATGGLETADHGDIATS
jgi:hypothetical protein